jgi:hypothetical protein
MGRVPEHRSDTTACLDVPGTPQNPIEQRRNKELERRITRYRQADDLNSARKAYYNSINPYSPSRHRDLDDDQLEIVRQNLSEMDPVSSKLNNQFETDNYQDIVESLHRRTTASSSPKLNPLKDPETQDPKNDLYHSSFLGRRPSYPRKQIATFKRAFEHNLKTVKLPSKTTWDPHFNSSSSPEITSQTLRRVSARQTQSMLSSEFANLSGSRKT